MGDSSVGGGVVFVVTGAHELDYVADVISMLRDVDVVADPSICADPEFADKAQALGATLTSPNEIARQKRMYAVIVMIPDSTMPVIRPLSVSRRIGIFLRERKWLTRGPRRWNWRHYGRHLVAFPRGIDVSNAFPKKFERVFDEYLCHGIYDESVVQTSIQRRKINATTRRIGYPRYDGYRDRRATARQAIIEEFDLDSDKPIILWMPSSKGGMERLAPWIGHLSGLVDAANVICRLHPKYASAGPKFVEGTVDTSTAVDQLRAGGIYVDLDAQRTLVEHYAAVDLVLADYGGSIFSAIYCERNVVLLDSPGMEKYLQRHRLDARVRNVLPVIQPDESTSVVRTAILSALPTGDDSETPTPTMRLRQEIFGDFDGRSCARDTATYLNDLRQQHS